MSPLLWGLPEREVTRNNHCTNAATLAMRNHPRHARTAGGSTIQKMSGLNDPGTGPCHKTSDMATGPARAAEIDEPGPWDHPR